MNIDDDSDLTPVESGEDDDPSPTYAPPGSTSTNNGGGGGAPAKGRGGKNGNGNGNGGYAIKQALKPPRATTYSAKALFEAIGDGDIDLEAEYQRDVVWQDTKQIGLIDSIFRNFYVPPIIFAAKMWEDGTETKICIDGKQRLTSIRRFMEGHIPHKDPTTSEKWWYIDNPGATGSGRGRKKILPNNLRRQFEGKQIVCVEYQDITDADEREIFQRVQLGMALTPAEKLGVISSPRSNLTRSIVNTHITSGSLNPSTLDWDATRGADFRCVASALWCIHRWLTDKGSLKTVPSVMQLEKWLTDEEEVGDAFERRVREAFALFGEVVEDRKLGRTAFRSVFSKESVAKDMKDGSGTVPAKVSPLEFIFTAVLIGVHKDRMGKEELAGAVGGMRRDVRERHVDVRLNSRVGKTMLDYLKALEPGSGAVKGEASDDEDVKPTTKKGASKAKGGGKRKRKDEGEDEGSEMQVESEDDADDEDYGSSSRKKPKVKASPAKKTNSVLVPPPPLPSSSSAQVKSERSNPPTPSLPSRKPTLPSSSSSSSIPTTSASSSRISALRAASARGMAPPLPSFKKTPSTASTPTLSSLASSTSTYSPSSAGGPPTPTGTHTNMGTAAQGSSVLANPYILQAASFNAAVPPTPVPSSGTAVGTPSGLPTPPTSSSTPSWEHSAYQAQLQAAAVHGHAFPQVSSSSASGSSSGSASVSVSTTPVVPAYNPYNPASPYTFAPGGAGGNASTNSHTNNTSYPASMSAPLTAAMAGGGEYGGQGSKFVHYKPPMTARASSGSGAGAGGGSTPTVPHGSLPSKPSAAA